MKIAESKRLYLRQFKSGDKDWLLDIFADEDVMRYSDGVKSIAELDDWLTAVMTSYRVRDYGHWAVVRKKDVTPLGYCGLSYEADVCGQPEVTLGYRLARSYWGKGYATEAVLTAVGYSFNTLGLHRLVATVDPNNSASVRVAEKAGMQRENEVMYEGYTHPDHVYALGKIVGKLQLSGSR